MRKTLLAVIAILAFAVFPTLNEHVTVTHASIGPHACAAGQTAQGSFGGASVCYNTGTNGCTGPLVGVFGSSALKTYVTTEAAAYCNTFANKATAPDVEYSVTAGADSCPGVDYAADNSDTNEVGVADVFAGACTGPLARPASAIGDHFDTTNVVDTITECPGADAPQGGAPSEPGTHTPCLGNGDGNNDRTFCPANDEAQLTAQQVWLGNVIDWSQIGGTSAAVAACANGAQTQNRQTGSGTRATWCLNVYNGADSCTTTASAAGGDASTTTVMLNDICGNPFTAAGAIDPEGTIGYATRGALVVDPRTGNTNSLPLANCGIVPIGGNTGWNGTCNPATSATTCAGDAAVENGTYFVWGYEHFDLNPHAGSNNAAASAFVTFVETNAAAQNEFTALGFIKKCKMLVQRSVDAGSYTLVTPSC